MPAPFILPKSYPRGFGASRDGMMMHGCSDAIVRLQTRCNMVNGGKATAVP
jgi:hypothetical protein